MPHSIDLTTLLPRLVLLTGHSAPIESIAFSPDGRTLATGSYDHTVILWDLPTNSMRARLPGHGSNLRLAFSPDGATLATVDTGAIRLWETATGRWLSAFPGYTGSIAFVSATELLAGASVETLIRLDHESGQALDRITLGTPDPEYDLITISPDATTAVMAARGSSNDLLIWDLPSRSLKRRRRVPPILRWRERDARTGKLYISPGAQADVHHLAISPNNRLLAVGGRFTLWLCDLRTGKRTHLLLCGRDGTQSLAFSPCGKMLAAGTTSGAVELWAIPSGREVQSFAAHTSCASAVAFSPDGQTVASASHDKTVKVWDADSGECVKQLPGLQHDVLCVAYAPGGHILASGHADGTIRCWDAGTGELCRTLTCQHREVASLAFSADGRQLICSSFTRIWRGRVVGSAVALVDTGTGERLRSWKTLDGVLTSVAFPASGDFLLVSRSERRPDGADDATFAWDLRNSELRYQVKGRAVAVTPDGCLLATTTGFPYSTGVIPLWDALSGELVREMAPPAKPDGIASLCFSPDGCYLLAGFDGWGIGMWEVATGARVWETRAHADTILATAFSPDGKTVAVGGAYRDEVALWDLEHRVERLVLAGHTGNIRAVAFSPSGDQVATAAADGAVKVWRSSDGSLLATLLVLPATDGSVSKEWITYTPSGHYLGSAEAEEFVRWQVGDEWLPAETFRGEFCRPEVVAAALR